MSEEFERLMAQFEQFQSKIEQANEQFNNLDQLQSDVGEIEATTRSNDQTVSVTAGPGGGITDITFTAQALRQQPDDLANTVLSTLREAVADAARQQASIVDTHMGDNGFDATERVIATQAELFGTDADELRARVTDHRNGHEPEADRYDDYTSFAEQSFVDSDDTPRYEDAQPQESGEPRSAGEEFLRNLFNDDDEGHR